jgi:hypothetical protein
MVKIDLLTESEEGSYRDFLARCTHSSVQYSLDWRNTISDLGKDEPFFVVAKENDEIVGILPLYYYRSKLGNLLTTIAWHTISGIMLSNAAVDKNGARIQYNALLDYSVGLAKELDCTALSISTNPFLDDREFYSELRPDYSMKNFIQFIDLREIFDKQGNAVHPDYVGRTNLSRNLKTAGLQNTIVSDEAKRDKIDECFCIYSKRMDELNATPVPKEMFDSITKNLISNGKGKFVFALNQGKVISAALVLYNDRMLDFYMMCMDSEYRQLRANFLIIYHVLKWANNNGISILNWQSSPNKQTGVFQWKEQWGSHELNSLYLTKILGDISQWKNMDLKELKRAYSFHYLLPFNLLKSENRSTTKDEVSCFLSRTLQA